MSDMVPVLCGSPIRHRENACPHNPRAQLYDPSRKSIGAAAEFIKENLNVAAQYGDWLTSGDVASVSEIPAGEGAVIWSGANKVAVYRESKDAFYACSAVCTHLGCVVAWNAVEKSWDCPCHGSRFDGKGKVLNGPAVNDLQPASLAEISQEPSRAA